MHTAATDGIEWSVGSGRTAFAHMATILPGVSMPSSVVRSMQRMARSSAHSLDSRLIERLASDAARSSRPTASTAVTCAISPAAPGGPNRARSRGLSEIWAGAFAICAPGDAGRAIVAESSLYSRMIGAEQVTAKLRPSLQGGNANEKVHRRAARCRRARRVGVLQQHVARAAGIELP